MKQLRNVGLHIMAGAAAVYGVYRLDPSMQSKVHGPLLIALAFIFTLQDSVFWLCRRKLDDFLKSEGIPIEKLQEVHSKVEGLFRYITKLWLATIALRLVALSAGIWLQWSDSTTHHRIAIAIAAYSFVTMGMLLAWYTYVAYQHIEKAHRKREVLARENAAREKDAESILAQNSTDWTSDPSLSGYGKPIKIKTH